MKHQPTIKPEDIPEAPLRWGDAELESLRQALTQRSLFYWKNGATGRLEEAFQAHYPLKYVMPVSSGTASIHVALAAAGIAPGDEVITTPITDMGTVIGALYQQAVPVFADLEPYTYNLDPASVEAAITPKTKAILAVHLTGNPADMDALKAIADKHSLVLIEDCAQAWGALYKGEPVGTIGDIACFSFNDFKHISCGDGGIVASNNETFGPLLQKYADKGYDRVTGVRNPEVLGLCYRMTELQAAVASVQVEERMQTIANRREQFGRRFNQLLEGIPGICSQFVRDDDFCTYWFTMFRIEPGAFSIDRDEFVKRLNAEGLQASGAYIPQPIYKFPVFREMSFFAGHWPLRETGLTSMDYRDVVCPEAESILETAIRVEIQEWMSDHYIELAAKAVWKVAEQSR
jgi:dTDP-4-amino-4,6-dideoxygalactose transaminase